MYKVTSLAKGAVDFAIVVTFSMSMSKWLEHLSENGRSIRRSLYRMVYTMVFERYTLFSFCMMDVHLSPLCDQVENLFLSLCCVGDESGELVQNCKVKCHSLTRWRKRTKDRLVDECVLRQKKLHGHIIKKIRSRSICFFDAEC
jgi:hypothetical protein